ncbi:Lytic transglycosylase, catalytic [Magnetococcus marinus MC-1]|uniref:Lytic transglycosylase, catalytic n=1 Tax=Magnetococcus marinus (strain ATCC BAA-1437 / JCM 17883 / MC-1) TaxID=156889 RepID=A0L421_MAGMM|nr:lytic transglycosylase domain-containing protein [Magnetococcus marinus]ABK42714.1 Lytic transglycosylase, catalytic [Magnetococcus marinus MC-1]
MIRSLLILICLMFSFSQPLLASPKQQRQQIQQLIIEEAKNLNIPISLALAVAHVESYFDPQVESHKGACGVMQIMPATAMGEYGIPKNMLWNPKINVRLGLHFLQRLLQRYKGRVNLALSYYNGGSRVGDLPHAHIIPATRPYVAKVRHWQKQYQYKLYHGLDLL